MKLSIDHCPNYKRCLHRAKSQIVHGLCEDCGTYVGDSGRARSHPTQRNGASTFIAMNSSYHGSGNPDL